MKRRDFLKQTGVLAAGLTLTQTLGVSANGEPKRPNIVFIMADDLGFGDMSCYGATALKTPHCDKMAAEGLRMTDAHTPAAVCTPTRYGLLTGRYCWRTRLKRRVLGPVDPLLIDTDMVTLPSMLKEQGYATACIGKWHLGLGNPPETDYNAEPIKPGPLEVGFDYWFGIPGSNNLTPWAFMENHSVYGREPGEKIVLRHKRGLIYDEVQGIKNKRVPEEIGEMHAKKAVAWIDKTAPKKQPFFLYVPLCPPHLPLTPGEQFEGTSQAGAYGDFIHEFDWCVGQIVEALKKHGVLEDTLLIITSDNGANSRAVRGEYRKVHKPNDGLRGMKADIYEGGHRVPFIVRWPGHVPAGEESDAMVSLVDMTASFAELVGAKLPEGAAPDSRNVLPQILGQTKEDAPNYHTVQHSGPGMYALRKGSWKYVDGTGSGGWGTNDNLIGQGEQLYNVDENRAEKMNVADQHPDLCKELKALLDMERARDV